MAGYRRLLGRNQPKSKLKRLQPCRGNHSRGSSILKTWQRSVTNLGQLTPDCRFRLSTTVQHMPDMPVACRRLSSTGIETRNPISDTQLLRS